ncbi:MAG TPA: anaerobic glycerol-3-phosphate dehydrogenase subunit C [Candidatus Polarisedimenticolia bacterium]|nr:anaerobic glycerol-3-phosphate dehydrogenase subunit C [Candidatus Polarisedimenticolia bacterium]
MPEFAEERPGPDREAAAVADDLRRRVEGEVLFDPIHRTLYSTAACIYQIMPLGAVVARHEGDVLAVLDYARQNHIPITARGGGSGLAGQTLGRGIVLDFSKHFQGIADIDAKHGTVRVQPGVVQARLNRVLRRHGMHFAPDPSSAAWCTVGGMLANNAGGSHTVKRGATRENTASVRAALVDGTVIDTEPLPPPGQGVWKPGAQARLASGLHEITRRHRESIDRHQPSTRRNASGYALREAVAGPIDLAQVLVGSEGTLGLILDATLRIAPLPKSKATALVLFDDLEKSGAAVVEILSFDPSAVELLDRTFVQVVREADPKTGATLPDATEAILIVELEGDEIKEVQDRMGRLAAALTGRLGLATDVRRAARPEDTARIWAVRKAASPILSRREGTRRNTRFIEDAAVHPEQMAEFVRRLRELLRRHGLQAAIFGHAGDCNLHCNPMLNQKDPRDLALMETMAEEFTDLVIDMGGSLSGEHGDGRLRTPYLRRAYGPLVEAFQEVKRLFDPTGILNPGIIVHDGRSGLLDDLRYGEAYRRVPTATTIDDGIWQKEIEKCHGCGACRNYCPVAVATQDEAATARAKANLLRAVISGRLDPGALATDAFKSVMDLCVNCQLCHSECPTAIDIPGMAVMAKEVYVRSRGKDTAERVLTNPGPMLRVGTMLAPLANAALRFGPGRRLMAMMTGVASRRDMAPFDRSPLRTRVPSVDPGGRRVAYFHGCFGGYQDVEGEGRAAVELLEALGCTVAIPPQECCGIAAITYGHLDDVRASAERNVAALLDLTRRGYEVVYSAPSCGLALVEDYPRLLGTPQSEVLARHIHDIHQYVLDILEAEPETRARLRSVPVRLTYHNPCHMQARGLGDAVVRLLSLVPEVEVVPIVQDHCCGIAGTFGMKEKNFALSMRMGAPLFESIEQTGVGVVATGCGTCKIQIEQGSGLPVVHPIRIVRDSFLGGPLPPRVAAAAPGRPCAPARPERGSADDASACPE